MICEKFRENSMKNSVKSSVKNSMKISVKILWNDPWKIPWKSRERVRDIQTDTKFGGSGDVNAPLAHVAATRRVEDEDPTKAAGKEPIKKRKQVPNATNN
jgi:hypothetical protein